MAGGRRLDRCVRHRLTGLVVRGVRTAGKRFGRHRRNADAGIDDRTAADHVAVDDATVHHPAADHADANDATIRARRPDAAGRGGRSARCGRPFAVVTRRRCASGVGLDGDCQRAVVDEVESGGPVVEGDGLVVVG